MTISEHEPQGPTVRGWKTLTSDERKLLSPIERARARTIDSQARAARDEARLARLEKLAGEKERKRDTRRKLLIGAVVQAWATEYRNEYEMAVTIEDPARWLHQLLDTRLTRDADRALFDLPPR